MRADGVYSLTEAGWQAEVLDLAQYLGWACLHVRPTIGKGGQWTTSTSVVGFPDLFCWHPRHGFAAIELKSERGKVRPEQAEVLHQLEAAGARTLIARPSDIDTVISLLRGAA